MAWFTNAKTHDHVLLKKLMLDSNIIYVFDKEYNDYKAYKRFCDSNTGFVTQIKDNAVYGVIENLEIDKNIHRGVLRRNYGEE